jgi:V/A-type H+-transporting ATPase subunit I
MLKLKVVTVKDSFEKALSVLQEAGVLHIEEAKELSPVEKEAVEDRRTRVRRALTTIQDVLASLPEEREVFVEDVPVSVDEAMEGALKLQSGHARLLSEIQELEQEIALSRNLERYLTLLPGSAGMSLRDFRHSGPYLFTAVYVFSEEGFRTFRDRASSRIIEEVHAPSGSEIVGYVIARKEDRKALEEIVSNLGAVPLDVPDRDDTLSAFLAEEGKRREERERDLAGLRRNLQGFIRDNLPDLALYREVLTAEYERLSALDWASGTPYVTLMEGWVPEGTLDAVTGRLREAVPYSFIDSRPPEKGEEPPTRLRNPKGVRPFEVVVKLFSVPRYREWDPTPVVAYFFAFFFGLMLNDMVYAAGLLILARFFLDRLVEDPTSEGTMLFRRVLYIGGVVSLVFGILSGTYMGDFLNRYFGIALDTVALSKVIQQKLSDPISFIVLALIIGLVHLNLAHILGLIRGIQERNRGIVLNKIGLFLVQIFGIPYLFHAMLQMDLVPVSGAVYGTFAYPMYFGLVLVVVGSVLQMGTLGAVFWLFDVTGILGDVMSYSRLAGVGLATFYLASSFNLLADWVSRGVSSALPGVIGVAVGFILGVVLLVIFHVFNLLLSILAAFIHSLRLCFVEFLLKFFEGGGREYSPLQWRLRKRIILGKKS